MEYQADSVILGVVSFSLSAIGFLPEISGKKKYPQRNLSHRFLWPKKISANTCTKGKESHLFLGIRGSLQEGVRESLSLQAARHYGPKCVTHVMSWLSLCFTPVREDTGSVGAVLQRFTLLGIAPESNQCSWFGWGRKYSKMSECCWKKPLSMTDSKWMVSLFHSLLCIFLNTKFLFLKNNIII